MRAAVYVRVSTDEQATSAETQESEARRFALRRGWEVVEVYRDVGVSGANFRTRPGLLKLLADVRAKPLPWEVLILQRLDRLGRDAAYTTITLQEIDHAGAQVWSYAEGSRLELDLFGKAMVTVRGAFAELERGLIVERVTEGLRAAAEARRATGGRCYGYRTARVEGTLRQVVHEPEAAVVRWIFEEHHQGRGLRELVYDLNARGVPSPRTGTGTWSPSAVQEILRRVRYRGVVEYGQTHKSYRGGDKIRTASPERVITVEAPDLRIVPDELWHAVQSEQVPARATRKGREPRYLLTGYARCSVCGGPMQVSRAKRGTINVPVYLCAWARDRGATVCVNKLRRPVEEVEDALRGWMHTHVATPRMVDAILDGARAEFAALDARPAEEQSRLREDLARAVAQVERLADLIAGAETKPEALVKRLVEAEGRARDLRARLDACTQASQVIASWTEIERETRERLGRLDDLLGRDVAKAREVLGTLLTAPLRCHPVEVEARRRYRLTGEVVVPVALDLVGGDGQTKASLERPHEIDRQVAQDLRPRLVLDTMPDAA